MNPTIGCDPGVTGCIVLLSKERYDARVLDTGSPVDVADAIRAFTLDRAASVVLERTHTMPKMGARAAMTFGESVGVVRGVCAALGLPVTRLSAQTWQKVALQGHGVPADRKARMDAVVSAAKDRWPTVEWPTTKKGREALASALWIAEVGSRKA